MIAEGTPEQVAEVAHSYTGQYMKRVLEKAGRTAVSVVRRRQVHSV